MTETVYGLIGEKLGHSFSPQIHDEIFKRLGTAGKYNLYEAEANELGVLVEKLKDSGVKGFNVTVPYKIRIMNFLDSVSKEAEDIGAVNTVSLKDGFLTGYNTDYFGFGMTLKKEAIEVKGSTVAVLGTGGASRAVAQYLSDNGAGDIIHVSRNAKSKSADIMPYRQVSYDELNNLSGDIIINCTPCGMYPNVMDCPVSPDVFKGFGAAVDLIYNPEKTVFLQYAEGAGLKAVNGLYMLVGQAVAAHEIWCEASISSEVVEEVYQAVREMLYNRGNG